MSSKGNSLQRFRPATLPETANTTNSQGLRTTQLQLTLLVGGIHRNYPGESDSHQHEVRYRRFTTVIGNCVTSGLPTTRPSGRVGDIASAQPVTVESPQIASQLLPEADDDPHVLR